MNIKQRQIKALKLLFLLFPVRIQKLAAARRQGKFFQFSV